MRGVSAENTRETSAGGSKFHPLRGSHLTRQPVDELIH